jgi:uncharacterized membrane protein
VSARWWLVLLAVLLICGAAVHVALWQHDTRGQDIYSMWTEGQRILHGENPYARILTGNMAQNQKYPTYFPGIYLSIAGTSSIWPDYDQWLGVWRVAFLLFCLGTAAILFSALNAIDRPVLGILAAAFWLFNRWTLILTQIAHTDVIPIFTIVFALWALPRHRWLALLVFSFGLSIKQIGLVLVPVYLIWIWQNTPDRRIRELLRASAVMASVPVITSVYFLAASPEGYLRSILFSITRNPEGHFGVPSLDAQLGWSGPLARLPMLALLLVIWFTQMRTWVGRFVSSLLSFSIFVDYNSVLFVQYLAWIVPLLPLALLELPATASRAGDT